MQPERRKTYSNKIRFLLNNNIFCAHILKDALLLFLTNNKRDTKLEIVWPTLNKTFPTEHQKNVSVFAKAQVYEKELFVLNFFKNIVFKNVLGKHPFG